MVAERPTLKATWLTQSTLDCARRFCIHQGGTRSSKTYSLAIALAYVWETERDLVISVVRKTGPALKATVYRDVIEVLEALDIYDVAFHNKTDQLITNPRTRSVIEFFSCDEPQKVRGRKRDLLWANEANELTAEDFRQLNLRTTGRVWLDFNPSMQEHWIWETFEGDTDYAAQAEWHFSTYEDNPFLSAETVRQIEALRDTDPYAWEVYGLGKRGSSPAAVYPHIHAAEGMGEGEVIYGIDSGYNDPMVLVEVQRLDREGAPSLRCRGLVYETHLTRTDLAEKMKGELAVPLHATIYCEHDPDLAQTLERAGFADVRPADKGPGSVKAGIDFCKGHRIEVAPGPASDRLRSSLRGYRWKTRPDGIIASPEAPAHEHSHGPDALRYAAFTHYADALAWTHW
jgi:phage terminase large subunit